MLDFPSNDDHDGPSRRQDATSDALFDVQRRLKKIGGRMSTTPDTSSAPAQQGFARPLPRTIAMANQKAQMKDYAGASIFYNYGLRSYPADSKIWADYAGSSFMAQKFDQAQHAFDQAYNRCTLSL